MDNHINNNEAEYIPISTLWRLYIYAIHGYVAEVTFTAMCRFVHTTNLEFLGKTSIWTLAIYGSAGLFYEQMYRHMNGKVPFLVRILIYTVWTYAWEFSTGLILRQLDACPWDYTEFKGNFMGLITLEYAPFWFVGNLIAECLVLRLPRQLYWGPSTTHLSHHNEMKNE